jgi:NAD/NADP transhydrogenase beta subunit
LSTLYAFGPNGLPVFLFATVLLGGGAGFLMGRAVAATWRPLWLLAWFSALIGLGVRFIHYAMFAEPLLSLASLAIDWLLVLAAAGIGHWHQRARQMSVSYPWLRRQTP